MAASDKISSNQFHMHLYHGTSSKNVERIKVGGLGNRYGGNTPSVFLTHDYALAHYYADTAADQEGGNPTIVKVRANPRNLVVDYNSFEDPVVAEPYGAPYRSFDESKLKGGADWKNSLRESGSAVHLGRVSPKDILSIERVKRNPMGGW